MVITPQRVIIGIAITFFVITALVVLATPANASTWGNAFESCLAKPAYQEARTHGLYSDQE